MRFRCRIRWNQDKKKKCWARDALRMSLVFQQVWSLGVATIPNPESGMFNGMHGGCRIYADFTFERLKINFAFSAL